MEGGIEGPNRLRQNCHLEESDVPDYGNPGLMGVLESYPTMPCWLPVGQGRLAGVTLHLIAFQVSRLLISPFWHTEGPSTLFSFPLLPQLNIILECAYLLHNVLQLFHSFPPESGEWKQFSSTDAPWTRWRWFYFHKHKFSILLCLSLLRDEFPLV